MTSTHKGVFLAMGSALGSAVFFIPFKIAGTMIANDMVVMATLLVAAVLNTLTSLGSARSLDRISVTSSLAFGVLTVTGNYATSRALVTLGAGMLSVLQQTQILLVAAGGWLLLGERVSVRFAVGTAIVMGGLLVMRMPSGSQGALAFAGIVWALASSLSFAILHVVTRKIVHRIQPVWVNALRLWTAVLFLACLPGNAAELADLGLHAWLLCVIAGFVGPFLGRICLMYSLRYISASHSALISLVGPVFAFLLDLIILGRVPSLAELGGGVVIVIGVGLPVLELALARRPAPANIDEA